MPFIVLNKEINLGPQNSTACAKHTRIRDCYTLRVNTPRYT
jgi:hypothetical protein